MANSIVGIANALRMLHPWFSVATIFGRCYPMKLACTREVSVADVGRWSRSVRHLPQRLAHAWRAHDCPRLSKEALANSSVQLAQRFARTDPVVALRAD